MNVIQSFKELLVSLVIVYSVYSSINILHPHPLYKGCKKRPA